MLFHVDMIYLAKQAKQLCFEMRTVTKSNPERDFFSFMSKRRKYANVLRVLAQNKSILHMACTWHPLFPSDVKNRTDHVLWRNKCQSFQAQYRLRHRGSCHRIVIDHSIDKQRLWSDCAYAQAGLSLAFPWRCHYREKSRMWRRNKFTFTRFRGSSADAHPWLSNFIFCVPRFPLTS